MMAHSPQKQSRQPKIRSSCDGCGAVKGKCDRQHPECGRCMARGITCTYGISKKVGKPRRDKSLNGVNINTNTSTGTSTSTSASVSTTSENASRSLSTSASTSTWEYSNSNNNINDNDHDMFNMDYCFIDGMSGTGFNSNFLPSLPFGDWIIPDNFDTVATDVHLFDAYRKHDQSDSDSKDHPRSDTSTSHSGHSQDGGKHHDCHRQAHELLGTSLFTSPESDSPDMQHLQSGFTSPSVQMEGVSTSMHAPTSYFDRSNSGTHGVALDQVLLLNRKAIKRLASLLACPCAASPYLMMLYASLISAILARCQLAADSSSTWNALVSPGGSVALARISIGAFSVDDPRVQSALNIQLLAGELRTVASLIDTIASYECRNKAMMEEQQQQQQSGSTDVPKLYQNLATWLRDEHSRVTNVIGNKLRELNT